MHMQVNYLGMIFIILYTLGKQQEGAGKHILYGQELRYVNFVQYRSSGFEVRILNINYIALAVQKYYIYRISKTSGLRAFPYLLVHALRQTHAPEDYIPMLCARICFSLILSPLTNPTLTLLFGETWGKLHENDIPLGKVE